MKDPITRKPLTPAEEEAMRERIRFNSMTEALVRGAETEIKCARKRWREYPDYALERLAEARRHLDEAESRIRTHLAAKEAKNDGAGTCSEKTHASHVSPDPNPHPGAHVVKA